MVPRGTIEVEARNVYGAVNYYPANEQAKALAEIAGTRTITARVLHIARTQLGFSVNIRPDTRMTLGALMDMHARAADEEMTRLRESGRVG